MSEKGDTIFITGAWAGEIPGGDFIFKRSDGEEALRISDMGIFINGQSMGDVGKLHAAMMSFFKRGARLALADALAKQVNDALRVCYEVNQTGDCAGCPLHIPCTWAFLEKPLREYQAKV